MIKESHPREFYLLALAAIFFRCTFSGFGNLFVLFVLQTYPFSQEKTTSLYGIFTAGATFFLFVGGYLVDRWNYYQPLFLSPLLSILGFSLLLFHNEYLLYLTMGLLAIGYGLFNASSVPLLHHVYRHHESLREKGFLWFYSSFNLGVFFSMSLFGLMAKMFSWNMAWILGLLLSFLGLIPTILFYKNYHKTYENLHPTKAKPILIAGLLSEKKKEKDRIYFLMIINICSLFFWTFYNQGWSSLSLYLVSHVEGKIPVSLILSSSNLFLFLLLPLFIYLENRRKKKASLSQITSLALILLSFAFSFLVLSTLFSEKISFLYPTFFFLFLSIGELLMAPAGLSATTKLAPKKFTSFFVGIWYVFIGLAFYLGGQVAGFIGKMPPFTFFLVCLLGTLVPGIVLGVLSSKLDQLQHSEN